MINRSLTTLGMVINALTDKKASAFLFLSRDMGEEEEEEEKFQSKSLVSLT